MTTVLVFVGRNKRIVKILGADATGLIVFAKQRLRGLSRAPGLAPSSVAEKGVRSQCSSVFELGPPAADPFADSPVAAVVFEKGGDEIQGRF